MASPLDLAPTLLCGVDFSSSSDEAVAAAVALARAERRRIVLLHVIETAASGRGGATFTDRDMRELQGRLEELAADAVDLAIDRRLEAGEPAAAILRTAAEDGADLIVIGTRGNHLASLSGRIDAESREQEGESSRSPIDDAPWLGSVARHVMSRAACGVLAVGRPCGDGYRRRRTEMPMRRDVGDRRVGGDGERRR